MRKIYALFKTIVSKIKKHPVLSILIFEILAIFSLFFGI